MCFHFYQDMRVILMIAVFVRVRLREETRTMKTSNDSGIITVGNQGIAGMTFMGMTNHSKQGLRLLFSVDDPIGVEYLVPAMLGIGLGEHHQFDVGWVALETHEIIS